jgi:hypothetical protein
VSAEDEQLAAIRRIAARARLETEGGVPVVLLPGLQVRTSVGVETMNAVLCPRGHSGYATRLLLERRVTPRANLNWQEVSALGRNWHTWSWANVPGEQPWIRILSEHLRCLS